MHNTPIASPALNVIIVVGLSGAGKSTALQVFEDLGYFPVDGLPISLLPHVCTMMLHDSMKHFKGIALGISIHSTRMEGAHSADITSALAQVRAQQMNPCLIFLESEETELLRRYTTTRRPHPLERARLTLPQALLREKRLLAPVRNMAKYIFDTTSFSIHDLRRVIQQQWGQAEGTNVRTLKVNLLSFGFKYGAPKEADMLFDVRFLPNPYFETQLRPLSGQNKAIVDYIFAHDKEQAFLQKITDFLLFSLPLVEGEGRYRITLAIGCTGGRHRSVATAEHVGKAIQQAGYTLSLEHRHMTLAETHP